MAKSFKKNNPLDNLNEVPKLQEEPQMFVQSSVDLTQKTRLEKNIKKKYLRLDITDYQDYISLMSEYSSKTTNKYISMTQYILHLIEADKQNNSEIYHKLEEIENMKKNIT